MSLRSFLTALEEGTRVRVASYETGAPLEAGEAVREALLELDRQARLELPRTPPPLSLESAIWGAITLYRGCQFLVYREVSADAVKEALAEGCPEPASPAAVYSVDLTFRSLPDLLSLARGLAADDPLVTELMRLAREWPLSSVGVRDLPAVEVSAFIVDACLRQLYVDRIIERRDASRLTHSGVREAVRASLGLHDTLAPDIATRLREMGSEEEPDQKEV